MTALVMLPLQFCVFHLRAANQTRNNAWQHEQPHGCSLCYQVFLLHCVSAERKSPYQSISLKKNPASIEFHFFGLLPTWEEAAVPTVHSVNRYMWKSKSNYPTQFEGNHFSLKLRQNTSDWQASCLTETSRATLFYQLHVFHLKMITLSVKIFGTGAVWSMQESPDHRFKRKPGKILIHPFFSYKILHIKDYWVNVWCDSFSDLFSDFIFLV